jgi:A/G-specific adenine glycosylase
MHEALVSWFHENQRALPWRATYDPYHVWVSEIMLQQTQVETVIPYFERWIETFPAVAALAAAAEPDVMNRWAGLGYYSRARNLMRAAKVLVENFDGRIPSDYDALRSLPGVGQYTAGAILSIAFNKPYPVVDGNVRRVLSRIFGWEDDLPKRLWDAAGRLVREGEPRAINQAVMELGATVCSFKSPRCLVCPVQDFCAARKSGMQHVIPPAKKRPATVRVQLIAVVQEEAGRYLMRESNGLWEFPMFGELPAGKLAHRGRCRHTITHHRLEVQVYAGAMETIGAFQWVDFSAVPVSSLTQKVRRTAYAGGCDNL